MRLTIPQLRHKTSKIKELSPACLPIPPSRHYPAEAGTYKKSTVGRCLSCGAKDGVRTRDLDLGKVALYQLSYFRVLVRFVGEL